MDEGGFILDYRAPAGTALSETDRELQVIEKILRADPDVQAFTRRTGSELGFAATSPNTGDFTVLLKARDRRHSSVYEVMDRVRAAAARQAPSLELEFMQLMQDIIFDLTGAPEPVELKLFSRDQAAAERAAEAVAAAIEPVPGLVDLFDGVPGPNPELRVEIDPVRIARLGLTASDVEAQARAALFGADAGTAREPDRVVPIRVRLPDSVRFHSELLARLPIVSGAGWTPLGELGTVKDTGAASELRRENLRPYVAVTGRTSGRSLGSVMRDVRDRIARVALPAGVTLEIGGQYATQQASFRELLGVLGLAVGAVLLVLVAQFGSLRGPLAIVVAIPLGLTGALAMLAAAGVPFNVSSFMGHHSARRAHREERHSALRRRAPRVRCRRVAQPGPGARRPGAAPTDPHDHRLYPRGAGASGARSRRGGRAAAAAGAGGDRRTRRLDAGDAASGSGAAGHGGRAAAGLESAEQRGALPSTSSGNCGPGHCRRTRPRSAAPAGPGDAHVHRVTSGDHRCDPGHVMRGGCPMSRFGRGSEGVA